MHTVTTNGKDNLKESKESIWEGLERIRERGNDVIYYNLKNKRINKQEEANMVLLCLTSHVKLAIFFPHTYWIFASLLKSIFLFVCAFVH